MRKPRVERKKEILQTAADMAYNSGLSSLTIRALAKKVNISEAAIYRHFANKEELISKLLLLLFDPYLTELKRITDMPETASKKLLSVVSTHVNFLLSHRLNPILLLSEAAKPENEEILNFLKEKFLSLKAVVLKILEEGIQNGEFRSLEESIFIADYLVGIIQNAIIQWTLTRSQEGLNSSALDRAKYLINLINNRS